MSDFKLGQLPIEQAFFGNDQVTKIYYGQTLLYELAPQSGYRISASVSNGSYTGDTSIESGGTATITITANEHYHLPSSITVVGATYTYSKSTGVISLSDPTGPVSISVQCEEYAKYRVTVELPNGGSHNAPPYIYSNETLTIRLIAGRGYRFTTDNISLSPGGGKSGGVATSFENGMVTSDNDAQVTISCATGGYQDFTITATRTQLTASTFTLSCTNGTAIGYSGTVYQYEKIAFSFVADDGYILPAKYFQSNESNPTTFSNTYSVGTSTADNTVECVCETGIGLEISVVHGSYNGPIPNRIPSSGDFTVYVQSYMKEPYVVPNANYDIPRAYTPSGLYSYASNDMKCTNSSYTVSGLMGISIKLTGTRSTAANVVFTCPRVYPLNISTSGGASATVQDDGWGTGVRSSSSEQGCPTVVNITCTNAYLYAENITVSSQARYTYSANGLHAGTLKLYAATGTVSVSIAGSQDPPNLRNTTWLFKNQISPAFTSQHNAIDDGTDGDGYSWKYIAAGFVSNSNSYTRIYYGKKSEASGKGEDVYHVLAYYNGSTKTTVLTYTDKYSGTDTYSWTANAYKTIKFNDVDLQNEGLYTWLSAIATEQ